MLGRPGPCCCQNNIEPKPPIDFPEASNSLQEPKGEGCWAVGGPAVVVLVLFVLLSPGLLCQLPGNNRAVEFANFQTSPISIFVHTIIFFGFLLTIFVVGIQISSG